MGAWTNWGVGCCCGGNISNHCDSSAFESSCTDEGQPYPLSIPVGCSLPTGYTPMPGIVAVWNGTEWAVEADSSSGEPSDCPVISQQPEGPGSNESPMYFVTGITPDVPALYQWQKQVGPDVWEDLVDTEDDPEFQGATTNTLFIAFSDPDFQPLLLIRCVITVPDCPEIITESVYTYT